MGRTFVGDPDYIDCGEALKKHCETLLKRAEARIEKITIGPDGRAAGATPFDVES